jgi:arylsulfatase A-like enzyme
MARPVFHRVGRRHPRSLHVSLASKVPAGRVSDEIVHAIDLFPTLAGITGADVPKDRPIDGVVAVSLNGRFAPIPAVQYAISERKIDRRTSNFLANV